MEWSRPDLKCRIGSELIAADYRRGDVPRTKKQGNVPKLWLPPNTTLVALQRHIWTIYASSCFLVSAIQEA